MLRKCSSLIRLIKNIENPNLHTNEHVLKENILLNVKKLCSLDIAKSFHFALPRSKSEDRREMMASLPVKDEGTDGEKAVDIDSLIKRELHCGSCFSREDMFPDERTPTTLFDGIPFQDMPICNIRVSPNNTIFTLSDAKGTIKMLRSCGIEGFKNARKGTNIAAQATAISISTKALERGYKTVRVRIRGLGPGRMECHCFARIVSRSAFPGPHPSL
uniref:Ribosomal protein S11 n=1 Tax=Timema bartmani TaxID=61472 RepID=A0A7R9F628_9NEOP|nr:unnamed protein product [Timema bartmani]